MKMTRLIYPLIFAAALTVLGTGCKHKPVGLTQLHNPAETGAGDQGLSSGNGINTAPPVTTDTSNQTGGGNQADIGSIAGMIPDRAALANYTVHFKFDSAAILSSEDSNIEGVANALKSDPNTKLMIEGNCDERGTEEYNRALGDRRALAARQALAKQGVDAQRILTQSYGKDKPADTGHDEAAWAKNRRDEFVLLHPKQNT